MKTFRLFFGLMTFFLVSYGLTAQDTTDDSWENNGSGEVITGDKVGIGVSNVAPGVNMQLPGEFVLRTTPSFSAIGRNYSTNNGMWQRINIEDNASAITFGKNGDVTFLTKNNLTSGGADFWTRAMRVEQSGKVEIGFANTNTTGDYKLYVESGILTEKVKVATVGSTNWADYVFEKDYKRNSLEKVESFIEANKHLPNVPSAKEVEANGIEMVEMDATLLRQIEELWLHTIDINKDKNTLQIENDKLNTEITSLQTQNESLSKQVEDLNKQFEVLLNKVNKLETQP